MAECFCYLCKVMFSNGAMWNIRLFPEPVGATIKKSWPLTNPSTTILWLSVISLKPSFLFLPLSIALGTFISYASFAVFTPKPSAWQGRDWPGSSFLKIDLTKKAFPDWISLTTRRPENWLIKYSVLQARKVHFPTDHLTSRNRKQALRKSTYWHSNVFQSLQMQCYVFCTYTEIFLVSKQVRKSWYSRTKKTTLILYKHAAIQVQAFWRKLKKLRLFSCNKSLML